MVRKPGGGGRAAAARGATPEYTPEYIAPHAALEVRLDEHGFDGSWWDVTCASLDADRNDGRLTVEFSTLKAAEDADAPNLRERVPAANCRPVPPPPPPDFHAALEAGNLADAWHNDGWWAVRVKGVRNKKQRTKTTEFLIQVDGALSDPFWIQAPLVRPRWTFDGSRWEAAAPRGLVVYENWLQPAHRATTLSSEAAFARAAHDTSLTRAATTAGGKQRDERLRFTLSPSDDEGVPPLSSPNSALGGSGRSGGSDTAGDVELRLASAQESNAQLMGLLVKYRDRIEQVCVAARSLYTLAHAGASACGAELPYPEVLDAPLPAVPTALTLKRAREEPASLGCSYSS